MYRTVHPYPTYALGAAMAGADRLRDQWLNDRTRQGGRTTCCRPYGYRTREMADGSSVVTSYTITVDDLETLGPFDAGRWLSVNDVAFTGQGACGSTSTPPPAGTPERLRSRCTGKAGRL